METQIAVGIVAHLSRSSEAKALCQSVRADFISIDNSVMGCDMNHDAVQRHLSALRAEWSVVLEDDAVPVDDFRDELGLALRYSPAPVVGLYLGRKRPPQYQSAIGSAVKRADAESVDWIVARRMFHGVGYAIRADVLPSLLEHPLDLPADERISDWVLGNGHLVAYCWPSLVDHADLPTVISRHRDGAPRNPGRVAWRAGGHCGWSSRAVFVVGS